MENCIDRSGRDCSYVKVYSPYHHNVTVFTWWLALARDPFNNKDSNVEFNVLLIITIIGIIVNIVVLMVIIGNKKLSKIPTHQYSAAQNINYLLFMCVAPMLLVTRRVYMWTLSSSLCKMILYTFSVSTSIAIWLFVFISMDRHISVVQAVKKSRLAKVYPKYPLMAIVVLIVFSVLFYIPVTIYFEILEVVDDECTESTKCFMGDMNQTVYVCASVWRSTSGSLAWNIIMLCISYIIPSMLISYNYWEIYHNVRKARRRIRRRRGKKAMKTEMEIQVTITCGLLVILFLLMWTPVFITLFLIQFAWVEHKGLEVLSADTFYWIFSVTLANAVVNPLVYAIMNKKFLQAWHDYRFPLINKLECWQKLKICYKEDKKLSSSPSLPQRENPSQTCMERVQQNGANQECNSSEDHCEAAIKQRVSVIIVHTSEDTV